VIYGEVIFFSITFIQFAPVTNYVAIDGLVHIQF